MSYKATSLWSTTLGLSGSKDDASIENLRVSYEEFRRNAQSLTSKISSSLQDLTIHDISHLDALWEVADVIAGENYPLNPMEAFVFGGAILLHDSALCVEAYSDGLQGIRKSVEWRDAFEAERRRNGNALASDLEKSADFAAMRLLHAHQAATLAERSWTHPSGSGVFHLIENQSLRHHYGALIGKIASSHHWDIERVETELGSQFNALPGYPRNWIVDPVKIACLLRCADALHVDNRRAPDFLHVLAKRHGISGRHWQAQNWLSQPGKLSEDKTGKIVAVTSTRHFPASESQSWWVAFDALKLADKEISSSNDLLARRRFANSPEFETRSIAGSESPERMVSFVRTTGWTPVDAGIHVGNVFELVRSLGGENLYGDGGYVTKLFVVLRELIHNAKDAISARAKFDVCIHAGNY